MTSNVDIAPLDSGDAAMQIERDDLDLESDRETFEERNHNGILEIDSIR